MSENKRNCNTCIRHISCKTLANNEEYQKLNGIVESHRFMENFICDNYKSMYIEYPIEVSKINYDKQTGGYRDKDIGRFVSIRPCAEECKNKTYLGIYLGDLPISNHVTHNSETKELNVGFMTNPAIFVFDLKKIVYGCESWWGLIQGEEDLKQITDADINNVWYVKALKTMSQEPTNGS
jgi:hypothetical protein